MKRKEKRNARIKEKTTAVIEAYNTATNTDPLGMYTGIPFEVQSAVEGGKVYIPADRLKPQQDADDL